MSDQPAPVSLTLRDSVREMIRESGLKQAFIARQIGITEKHMSQMLRGKSAMTIEWAEKIVDVCRKPLRIDLTPTEWVRDVVTWRERAELASAMLREVLDSYHVAHNDDGEVLGAFFPDAVHPDDYHRWRAVLVEPDEGQ